MLQMSTEWHRTRTPGKNNAHELGLQRLDCPALLVCLPPRRRHLLAYELLHAL